MFKRTGVLTLLVLVGLSSASRCGSENVKAPDGAFPKQVGSLTLMDGVGSYREGDHTRHTASYGYEQPGQNSVMRVIQYDLRVYPSTEQALAELEAQSQAKTDFERLSWEDRLSASGLKMGRVLVKDASATGYCSLRYARDAYLLHIQSNECEPARKFLQNLTF